MSGALVVSLACTHPYGSRPWGSASNLSPAAQPDRPAPLHDGQRDFEIGKWKAHVGQFSGRRGEFYASDTFQDRAIYIRFVWQNVSSTATHFEQAFSSDGAKTWEINWIYDGTRLP